MPESVLPLVVRIERANPPTRTDALEAAARSVLVLLTADRLDWADAIAAWDGSGGATIARKRRIRKVIRRARGADWRRAAALDGLEVRQGTAQLRVYPPIPLDGWPPELAKLQVGGTELEDPTTPADPRPGLPLILLAPRLGMSAGKAMAQVGHAVQLGWWACSTAERAAWRAEDFALAVRVATPEQWAKGLAAGAPLVADAGFTEVAPGSQTAMAVLPWL